MSKIKAVLGSLSDVEGVLGSFVITDQGGLLGSTMPAVFDADVFSEAGPRLARLIEASSALADGFKGCVLKFAEHRLFVREVSGAFLGVLLSAAASLPALRVATNLVARKLGPLVLEAPVAVAEERAPATDRSPAVVAPPSAPSVGTPSAPRPMFFRGHRVGG
ncbi:MAG TPA: roadblock/LC7 domain-containing protein [Polyangiaceae bacterium]|nr:roadblock/LC7 domain-containing protein [Polyangiaceae bacterium]